jgi:hypothetical protein
LVNEYFAVIIGSLGVSYGKKEHTQQGAAEEPAHLSDCHGSDWCADYPVNGLISGSAVTRNNQLRHSSHPTAIISIIIALP